MPSEEEDEQIGAGAPITRAKFVGQGLAVAGSVAMAPHLLQPLASGSRRATAPKGQVIDAFTQEAVNFNPLLYVNTGVETAVEYSVFDAPWKIDTTGRFIPNLATEIPSEANGGITEKGRVWTLHFRRDVTWHDGASFTSIAPRSPDVIDLPHRFAPPLHSGYLLGSDDLGRDVFSRLLYAGRISLTVGLAAMVVTIVVGSLVGATGAYYGGAVDVVLMRLTDMMLCFPNIFLLLFLAAFISPGLGTVALIIGLTAWMEVARIVHAQVLALKKQDFILAAQLLGLPRWRIVLWHILPNTMAPILVAATLNIANAILLESYISFLGYGIQPPAASWGNMLYNAQSDFALDPWLAIFPGIMITLAVMSFNFIGDGLRDALDPRLKI